MSRLLAAFAAGALFGAGLTISRMVNPAKVIGFLDIAGNWDPSLALVMASALAVSIVAFRFTLRRHRPVLGDQFALPTAAEIDRKLIVGEAMFGVGWGLAGFCPGPALASLALGAPRAPIFVIAMVAGMAMYRLRPAPSVLVPASDG